MSCPKIHLTAFLEFPIFPLSKHWFYALSKGSPGVSPYPHLEGIQFFRSAALKILAPAPYMTIGNKSSSLPTYLHFVAFVMWLPFQFSFSLVTADLASAMLLFISVDELLYMGTQIDYFTYIFYVKLDMRKYYYYSIVYCIELILKDVWCFI